MPYHYYNHVIMIWNNNNLNKLTDFFYGSSNELKFRSTRQCKHNSNSVKAGKKNLLKNISGIALGNRNVSLLKIYI